MRAILAWGRVRMDLEMGLVPKGQAHSEDHEPTIIEIESHVSEPIIGFVPNDEDLDDEGRAR